jgi:fibronectin type 3 domain-containing protein
VNYKYAVKAVNGASTGAYKESAKLLYLAEPKTTISNASNGIKVSWTKSAGAKGYTVYRSEYTKGKWSSWKTMGTAAATKTSWVDKSAKAGVQYRYTVRAVNGTVKSTYTATAGLVRLAQPAVKATLSDSSVKVTWNKIAGAKSYAVYRSELVDGKWSSWVNVSSVTALSFSDTAITEGATYRYTVRAVNGKSLSSFVASAGVEIPVTETESNEGTEATA